MGRVKQTPLADVAGTATHFSSCWCAVDPAGQAQKPVCGCLLHVFPERCYVQRGRSCENGGRVEKKTSPCIYYSTGGRMPKRKTDSHCYAPGCHSGYPGGPKASLFAALTEDELRKKWECNLRRADKPLSESSAVCERHFEPRYILRDYVHIINGTAVRLPRGKPSLAPGAVPTLLHDCATYLSVAPVKERSEKKRSAAASAPAVGTKPRKSARSAPSAR
ncbi:hypothetical protein HPB49_002268 [Dermacentor silvarum]|uniref:Uncharacterized protein n=1 Tax=Dermacentor silvarum TaxID=543639 RepID=A0ACB8C1H0_DERSI|nr:hypothetical protein HPB49_002268 [Dermacentor silvarum]